jgi:hypothetical protein
MWAGEAGERLLVAVNYGGNQSQCYVRLPSMERPVFRPAGSSYRLRDLMSTAVFDRDGDELNTRGLFLDMPPWGYHVFDVTAAR